MPRLTPTARQDGFTLVELLVVIVIIGILASISLVAYLGLSNRSQAAAARADLRSLVPTIQSYFEDNGETYVGMTLAGLRTYDGGLDLSKYVLPGADLTKSTYCVETTGAAVWRKYGPSAPLENLSCP